MKKVILRTEEKKAVFLDEVGDNQSIFVRKEGKLFGMVLCTPAGWVVKLGGGNCKTLGHHRAMLEDCIQAGMEMGLDFYIDE